MCLENEGTRGEPIYPGWEPHGASRAVSREDVHTDEGVLDIQVRHVFPLFPARVQSSGRSSVTSPLLHQARGTSRLQEGGGVHEVLLQLHI